MTDETKPARKPAVRSDIPGTLRIDDDTKQFVRRAMAAMTAKMPGLKVDPGSAMIQLIRIGAEQVAPTPSQIQEAFDPSGLGGK